MSESFVFVSLFTVDSDLLTFLRADDELILLLPGCLGERFVPAFCPEEALPAGLLVTVEVVCRVVTLFLSGELLFTGLFTAGVVDFLLLTELFPFDGLLTVLLVTVLVVLLVVTELLLLFEGFETGLLVIVEFVDLLFDPEPLTEG